MLILYNTLKQLLFSLNTTLISISFSVTQFRTEKIRSKKR